VQSTDIHMGGSLPKRQIVRVGSADFDADFL